MTNAGTQDTTTCTRNTHCLHAFGLQVVRSEVNVVNVNDFHCHFHTSVRIMADKHLHTHRIEEVRRHHVKNHIHTHVQHVLASIRPIIHAEGLILHAACTLLEVLGWLKSRWDLCSNPSIPLWFVCQGVVALQYKNCLADEHKVPLYVCMLKWSLYISQPHVGSMPKWTPHVLCTSILYMYHYTCTCTPYNIDVHEHCTCTYINIWHTFQWLKYMFHTNLSKCSRPK